MDKIQLFERNMKVFHNNRSIDIIFCLFFYLFFWKQRLRTNNDIFLFGFVQYRTVLSRVPYVDPILFLLCDRMYVRMHMYVNTSLH